MHLTFEFLQTLFNSQKGENMGLFDRFKKKDKNIDIDLKFTNSIENELLFSKATQCLQENENEEAISLFNQILKTEPDNIHALNGKGSGLMQSGRLDDAEEIFNRSLEIKDNEMAYLNKAIICGNTGDYDKAIGYCDRIIELYPGLKDVAQGLRNTFIENKNENSDTDTSEFNTEAQELIERANKLKDTNEIWKNDLHSEITPDMPEFRRVTEWEAWELYEAAIRKDPKCETLVTSYINEIKAKLLSEFLFFNVTMNEDFDPERELDRLKLNIIMDMANDNYTAAMVATKQILTTIDENDIDAINYKGALSFYYDEIDEAIECFETVAESGGIYLFYGDFNKTFALRRKTMITGDAEYMVQAMDIYDEMLKDPQTFEKVKPYQREILDRLQDFMKVPLF